MCFGEGTDAKTAGNLMLGTSAIGQLMGFMGGTEDAKSQRRAARQAVLQNRKNAISQMHATVDGLNQRAMQRRGSTAILLKSIQSAASKARSSEAVRQAETGTSSADVALEIDRVESENVTNIMRENEWAEGQLQTDIESAHQTAANTIDGFRPPPIADPNPAVPLMGFMESYFKVMARWPGIDPSTVPSVGPLPGVGTAFAPSGIISGTSSAMQSAMSSHFGLSHLLSIQPRFMRWSVPYGDY